MTNKKKVAEVTDRMPRVMRIALLDWSAGTKVHGREMHSLIQRGLIENSHRKLTPLGQQCLEEIIKRMSSEEKEI